MQGGGVCAAVPGTRDGAVFVACAGDDVAVVFFALRCGAGGSGVCDYVHSYGFADAGSWEEISGHPAALAVWKLKPTLSADAAVAQNSKPHTDGIFSRPKLQHVPPFVMVLPLNEHLLLM